MNKNNRIKSTVFSNFVGGLDLVIEKYSKFGDVSYIILKGCTDIDNFVLDYLLKSKYIKDPAIFTTFADLKTSVEVGVKKFKKDILHIVKRID